MKNTNPKDGKKRQIQLDKKKFVELAKDVQKIVANEQKLHHAK